MMLQALGAMLCPLAMMYCNLARTFQTPTYQTIDRQQYGGAHKHIGYDTTGTSYVFSAKWTLPKAMSPENDFCIPSATKGNEYDYLFFGICKNISQPLTLPL